MLLRVLRHKSRAYGRTKACQYNILDFPVNSQLRDQNSSYFGEGQKLGSGQTKSWSEGETKSKTLGENLTWWKIAVEEKAAVLHSMKQRFNVQVDFASNFDDDKRLLDCRLAKVVADSIALAYVFSFLSMLLTTS